MSAALTDRPDGAVTHREWVRLVGGIDMALTERDLSSTADVVRLWFALEAPKRLVPA